MELLDRYAPLKQVTKKDTKTQSKKISNIY